MWRIWWDNYGGRTLGVAAGMLCGLIYLIVGFWDMLFCALLVGIGFAVGKHRDERRGPLFHWGKMTEWLSDRWPGGRS